MGNEVIASAQPKRMFGWDNVVASPKATFNIVATHHHRTVSNSDFRLTVTAGSDFSSAVGLLSGVLLVVGTLAQSDVRLLFHLFVLLFELPYYLIRD